MQGRLDGAWAASHPAGRPASARTRRSSATARSRRTACRGCSGSCLGGVRCRPRACSTTQARLRPLASFLRSRTNSARVVGIEINSCRAQQAARLSAPGLTFVQGGVRRLGFADATHAFLTSQCWGSELMTDVFGRLAEQAERLACMVMFGSLPHALELPPILGRWGTIDSFASSVSGTWDPAATALYLVRRTGCNTSKSCMRKMQKKLAAAESQAAREANVAAAAGDSPWRLPPPRWSEGSPLGTQYRHHRRLSSMQLNHSVTSQARLPIASLMAASATAC